MCPYFSTKQLNYLRSIIVLSHFNNDFMENNLINYSNSFNNYSYYKSSHNSNDNEINNNDDNNYIIYH